MAKAETPTTRAPRGAKPVSQAFLTALDNIPDASRAAVAKAAQVMIRDELKLRREKMKANAAKLRLSASVKSVKSVKPVKSVKSVAAKTTKPVPVAVAPAKRRVRKLPTMPVAA